MGPNFTMDFDLIEAASAPKAQSPIMIFAASGEAMSVGQLATGLITLGTLIVVWNAVFVMRRSLCPSPRITSAGSEKLRN